MVIVFFYYTTLLIYVRVQKSDLRKIPVQIINFTFYPVAMCPEAFRFDQNTYLAASKKNTWIHF
jgi:hypothetical protein